jgi:1,2-phenylacetyl-CoA epoxidase catalytic subunit
LACFDKKWPDEPFAVILKICFYINTWSLLQVKEDARSRLEFYAKVLERVAREAFEARKC